MNILVTGANGQLGSEIRNLAPGTGCRFIFTDVNELPGRETVHLDITNQEAVDIICKSEKIDVIINCAAYTDVAKAEDDVAFAELLNHKAAGNLAAAASAAGATLIHVSTDYVFGGDACVPYVETDEVNPLGVYGATKLQGEKAVEDSGCKFIIIRTAWLYSPYGKNFVKTIRKITSEKPEMKVVFDQVGTPTYARDLAGVILKFVTDGKLGCTGIYHFTDEGVISWYDFAKAICRLSGNVCDIRPCHSDEFPSKARRPHFSVLDKTKIKEVLGTDIPYWLDSLEDCIHRIEKEII